MLKRTVVIVSLAISPGAAAEDAAVGDGVKLERPAASRPAVPAVPNALEPGKRPSSASPSKTPRPPGPPTVPSGRDWTPPVDVSKTPGPPSPLPPQVPSQQPEPADFEAGRSVPPGTSVRPSQVKVRPLPPAPPGPDKPERKSSADPKRP